MIRRWFFLVFWVLMLVLSIVIGVIRHSAADIGWSILVALIVGLNVVGMRRNGFSQERRSAVKGLFRTLFREGLTVGEARRRLAAAEGEDAPLWAAFIDESKRGIMGGRPGRTDGD